MKEKADTRRAHTFVACIFCYRIKACSSKMARLDQNQAKSCSVIFGLHTFSTAMVVHEEFDHFMQK